MSAKLYMALALAACIDKQYEQAGAFMAQAAGEDDAKAVAEEFGAEERAQNEDTVADAFAPDDTSESSDDWELGDVDEEDAIESTSSQPRRTHSSLFTIGKILGAVISESSDSEDEDSEDGEPDPDFEGETLVPASFSSVGVVSAVRSPVTMRD